jgi:putative phage-type endonuclease
MSEDAELVELALQVAGLKVAGTVKGRHLREVSTRPEVGEDDWREWRRNGIGASDIAGILGLSPWSSPYSIYADKLGLLPAPEQTEQMEFGWRAEPMLAGYFTDRTGLFVAGEQLMMTGPEPWMRTTLDGFAFEGFPGDPDDAVAAVEFKTTDDPPDAWAQQVPLHYACQATWIALVTGQPTVIFGVLHRRAFRTYTFTPSADDLELLRSRAWTFWSEHVLKRIPPDVDGTPATKDALDAMFTADDDAPPVEADKETLKAIAVIKANEERIAACEKIIADRKNQLRETMGAATRLTSGLDAKGKPKVVATWKEQTRAEHVVKASSFRRLLIK